MPRCHRANVPGTRGGSDLTILGDRAGRRINVSGGAEVRDDGGPWAAVGSPAEGRHLGNRNLAYSCRSGQGQAKT